MELLGAHAVPIALFTNTAPCSVKLERSCFDGIQEKFYQESTCTVADVLVECTQMPTGEGCPLPIVSDESAEIVSPYFGEDIQSTPYVHVAPTRRCSHKHVFFASKGPSCVQKTVEENCVCTAGIFMLPKALFHVVGNVCNSKILPCIAHGRKSKRGDFYGRSPEPGVYFLRRSPIVQCGSCYLQLTKMISGSFLVCYGSSVSGAASVVQLWICGFPSFCEDDLSLTLFVLTRSKLC